MTHSNKKGVPSLLALFAIAFALLASGCTTRIGDLTFVSTKNVDLSNMQLDVKKGQRYTGEDCRFSLLGIPFGYPDLKEAIDQAIEKGNGNVMLDEVTYLKQTFFLVGDISCLDVEGTVLKTAIK